MANLKTIQSGATPLASDVNQLVFGLSGQADIGTINFVPTQTLPVPPSVSVNAAAGVLNGAYKYIVVLATGWKENNGNIWISGFAPSVESASVSPASQQVNLSSIPVGTTGVVGRVLYRTAAGGSSGSEKFLAWIPDTSTTTYTDNTADNALGSGIPTNLNNVYGAAISANVPTTNTTGTSIGGISLPSMQNSISQLQYDVYNLDLQNYYNGIITPKQGLQFDGFSDTNQADMTNTTLSANVSAGASSISVTSATGFKVGNYVSIVDATHYEEHLISSISGTTITLADTLTNGFSSGAVVARTSSSIDTTNKKLNGGTITATGTTAVTTPTNVVASAYDTSGNGGRKLVRLSNGWLVAGAFTTTATGNVQANSIIFYVSKDNGNTWSQLCWFNTASASANYFAIASSGTVIYCLTTAASTSAVHSFNFDATTVTNTDRSSAGFTNPDSGQTSFGSGVSLCIDGTGALHAVWCSKNSTYPNSNNIRYSKSTDGGTTWATPTQVITYNSAGIDSTNPCIVVNGSNIPFIVFQFNSNGSNYDILVATTKYTTHNWSAQGDAAWGNQYVYNGSSYSQANPCAAIDSNDNIHVVWQGKDATYANSYNIKYSKSTDGGNTWSAMLNLTTISPASQDQSSPSITIDKNNNLYVLFQGLDVAITTSFYNLNKIVNTAGTWGSVTTLTNNTTNSIQSPQTLWSKFNMNCDFTDPLTIYQDQQASAVKFRGTWTTQVSTPVKQTAYYAKRVSYPQAQSNAKLWLTRNVTVSTAPSTAYTAGSTSLTVSSVTNLAVGDTIEIREGTYWERSTISAINGSTITLSSAFQNAYDTSAVVARVDDLPNVAIVATGANEVFSGMTWQRSTFNADGTVEDTYYYQTSAGGTDVVLKITQTRNSTSLTPQCSKYGLAVGI